MEEIYGKGIVRHKAGEPILPIERRPIEREQAVSHADADETLPERLEKAEAVQATTEPIRSARRMQCLLEHDDEQEDRRHETECRHQRGATAAGGLQPAPMGCRDAGG